MYETLKKKFYIQFYFALIVGLIGIITPVVCAVGLFIDYAQTGKYLWLAIAISIIFVVALIMWIKEMRLLILDMITIKKGTYKKITGTVIGIKEKEQGGDPPTTKYYPIIKDEVTGEEVKLDVVDTDVQRKVHKYCRYSFLYLPHTKLAVIAESFSYINTENPNLD